MKLLQPVAVVLGMFALSPAFAAQVYKCVDAKGAIAYQAAPCPDRARQSEVAIRKDFSQKPPTPAPPMRAYGSGRMRPLPGTIVQPLPIAPIPPAPPVPPVLANNPPQQNHSALSSYECRMPDGEVFYQHSHCPLYVSTGNTTAVSYDRTGNLSVRDVSTGSSVEERAISHEEACRMINAHSAIGRPGHKRDEVPSTYDKNAGRDPCR